MGIVSIFPFFLAHTWSEILFVQLKSKVSDIISWTLIYYVIESRQDIMLSQAPYMYIIMLQNLDEIRGWNPFVTKTRAVKTGSKPA